MPCRYKEQRPGYRFETSDYDHFQVIWVGKGQVVLGVRESEALVKANSVILLPVKSVFSLRCESMGYSGIGVNLYGQAVPRCGSSPRTFAASAEIRALAGIIEHELFAARTNAGQLLGPLGSAFATLVVREAHDRKHGLVAAHEPGVWVERARQRLEMALPTACSVKDLLAGIGLSYRQLSRHFQEAFQETPKQYLLRRRIEETQRLLSDSKLSVTSIAHEFGFPSSQHFATQFRRQTGVTPSEWREGERGGSRLGDRLSKPPRHFGQ